VISRAKQIATTTCYDEIATAKLERCQVCVEREQRASSLRAIELVAERLFSRAARVGVSLAESPERGAAAKANVVVAEGSAGQRIADANVSIEVGERQNGVGVALVALDDDGKPEPKLAQPDGRWVDVDPEDRSGDDVATDRAHRSIVATCRANRRHPLERMNEKRP
jgi:hypothetical protein